MAGVGVGVDFLYLRTMRDVRIEYSRGRGRPSLPLIMRGYQFPVRRARGARVSLDRREGRHPPLSPRMRSHLPPPKDRVSARQIRMDGGHWPLDRRTTEESREARYPTLRETAARVA